jgi:predicted TPR repeat methyltransferase
MSETTDPNLLRAAFKTVYRELPGSPIAALIRRWQADDPAFAGSIRDGVPVEQALGNLGVRLCLADRLGESIDVLSAGLSLAPDHLPLINSIAVALERSGDSQAAERQVERSLALLPGQPDSWIFLGNLRQKRCDLPGAIAAYRSAVELDAKSAIGWQSLGIALQARGEFAEAIECLRNCIRLNHAPPAMISVLGQLFYSTGQFGAARDAYTAASEADPHHTVYRRMRREMRFICDMIDGMSIDKAFNDFLIDHAGFTIERDAEDLLHKMFALLGSYGHNVAARAVAGKRLDLFPDSASAQYLSRAIRADSAMPRSPDQYIIESFDRMAEKFDAHLTGRLGYDIPQKLAAALAGFIPRHARLNILDGGCGTGLCGPHVRHFAAHLTGVDLSPNMLEQCRRRGVYDSLVCSELTSFLEKSASEFDVIIAADVIIYFGDLVPLATAMARALRPGGLVAFSTETSESPGHHLLSSGRFAHHCADVRDTFARGFVELCCQQATVRLEAGRAVEGSLFVFRMKRAE